MGVKIFWHRTTTVIVGRFASRSEMRRRILLGDYTGSGKVMPGPIKFECAGICISAALPFMYVNSSSYEYWIPTCAKLDLHGTFRNIIFAPVGKHFCKSEPRKTTENNTLSTTVILNSRVIHSCGFSASHLYKTRSSQFATSQSLLACRPGHILNVLFITYELLYS